MLDKHLRYFIELVKVRNYTRASENLFVSQSTISKAISSLEKELGVDLVDIKAGNFSLTNAGKLLYDFSLDVTNYYDKQEIAFLDKIRNVEQDLTIGLPPTAGSNYFYEVITNFELAYPNINLKIREEKSKDIIQLLLDEKLDFGVLINPFDDDRFIKKVAYESEAVLVVSDKHRFSNKKTVEFSELASENFIQVNEEYSFYNIFKKYCNKAGFNPKIIKESYDLHMIIEMVVAGFGVTILPLPLIKKYVSSRVRYMHLTNPKFPWKLLLVYNKKSKLSFAMNSFIEFNNF